MNQKLYSVKESYVILYNAIRTMKYLLKAKRKKILTPEFTERIMLAVTEVNECQMCSYAHTKAALKMKMSNLEIDEILNGVMDKVPDDEKIGVLFAQNYAYSRGNIEDYAWEKCVSVYGETTSKGILGAIRIIMMGNVYGIVFGSFFRRFIFKSDKRSNLFYEIIMIISLPIFIPIVLVHVLISNILRKKII